MAARESLLNDLADLARLLPSCQQRALEFAQNTHKEITKVGSPISGKYGTIVFPPFSNSFFGKKFARIYIQLQMMDTEETDIAQLCAQNIVLWQHFLEVFSGREAVHQHLARIHHQLRVQHDSSILFFLIFRSLFDFVITIIK